MLFHFRLHGILFAIALFGTQAAGQESVSEGVVDPEICFSDDSVGQQLLAPLLRSDLGMSLEPVYYGEVFTNTRGGISTSEATRYEALLDLALTIDFQKMQSPLPGRFFLLAQNTHGQGLTEDFVGDTQVVSNIDSFDNIMQVSEYPIHRHSVRDLPGRTGGGDALSTGFLGGYQPTPGQGKSKINAAWTRLADPTARSTFSRRPYRYSMPTRTRSSGFQMRLAAK